MKYYKVLIQKTIQTELFIEVESADQLNEKIDQSIEDDEENTFRALLKGEKHQSFDDYAIDATKWSPVFIQEDNPVVYERYD